MSRSRWENSLCACLAILLVVPPVVARASDKGEKRSSSSQVCEGEFEFRYESTSVCSVGIPKTVKIKDRHVVPFSVNFNKTPPAIEGKAKYQVNMSMDLPGGKSGARMVIDSQPSGPTSVQLGPYSVSLPAGVGFHEHVESSPSGEGWLHACTSQAATC